jgi:hypothetical protein
MLGQASPISTRSWISAVDTVWEVSASRPEDVSTRPDTVRHFRIFRASFSNVEMSYGEDRPDTRHTEKSSLVLKIQELEEKLLETQLQLERVSDEKLTHILSIHKSPHDKTGLGYVASSSDIPFSSKIVFVPPTIPELPPVIEDKQKEKVNDDVPGTHQPHSIRRPPICHHCGLSGHIRPQCSLLKAQKAKAKKEVPRQA